MFYTIYVSFLHKLSTDGGRLYEIKQEDYPIFYDVNVNDFSTWWCWNILFSE